MTDKLKFLPREATREMLEAMDECSMEGYDERLYAGHAGSVYMAAWDAFHGQHCYCGDITNFGVIHRKDGPCHYPEHTSEYKRGYADAMNWKVQNHLEHLQPKEPEQEPVAVYGYCPECGAEGVARERRPDGNDCCANGHTYPSRTANKTPQRTWVGLTDDEIDQGLLRSDYAFKTAEAWRAGVVFAMTKLKEKNT